MNTELSVIHDIIQKTRSRKMIWYIEFETSGDVYYVCVLNIHDKKRLVFRFNGKLIMGEYYLSIKMITDKVRATAFRNIMKLTSNNKLYGDDMDILYHSIKYSNPKEKPEDLKTDY